MKKSLLLPVLVSILNGVQAQAPSDCTIPQLLKDEYKQDINQLAMARVFQLQSPDTGLVTIPQVYVDTIFGGLAAIFNATSIPERDSVFNLYCVHNMNGWPGASGGFLVQVDTTYSWTNAWQNLITITGDTLMDTILVRYDLNITNFYYWSFGNFALLSTHSLWNDFALMDSIKMVPGVLSAAQNSIIGAAGKIVYNTIGNTRYYDFYFEFSDCFDGCDNYRNWMFKVNADCSVEYLGFTEWGYFGILPLPAPISCNTFTSVVESNMQKANFSVFPNPSTGKLQFAAKGFEFAGSTILEIHNAQGEIVHKSAITNPSSEVDISNHANGIYFIRIYDEYKTIYVERIAKL